LATRRGIIALADVTAQAQFMVYKDLAVLLDIGYDTRTLRNGSGWRGAHMALIKLKHKGQMTLPAEIRDRLQLQRGDLLEATTDGRSVILTPKTLIDREALKAGEGRKSTSIHK